MTLQEFTAIFSRVLAVFNEVNFNELKGEVYYNLLKEFSAKDFGEACKKVLLEYEYKNGLPMPATFYKACESVIYGDLDLKAIDAFNTAKREISRLGDAVSVHFADKGTMFAINSFGGWVSFCNLDFESGTGIAIERKFVEFYKKGKKEPLKIPYFKGTNELRDGWTHFDKEGKPFVSVAVVYKNPAKNCYFEKSQLLEQLEAQGLISNEMSTKNNPALIFAKNILENKKLS